MNPTNMLYLEQKYAEWVKNPESVPVSFQVYFENIDSVHPFPNPLDLPPVSIQQVEYDQSALFSQIFKMITDFEDHGHYYSDVDPTEFMIGKS